MPRSLAHALTAAGRLIPAVRVQAQTLAGTHGGGSSPVHLVPGGADAITLLQDAHNLASQWCLMVLETRPGLAGRIPGHTEGRIEWLGRHAEWLEAEEPDAAAAAVVEFGDVVARAKAMVAPAERRRVPVALCPTAGCGGELWVELGGHVHLPGVEWSSTSTESLPPAVCDRDGSHWWSRADHPDLLVAVGADGPERLTVEEWVEWVAGRWGRRVPVATVRSWCRVHPGRVGWDGETVDRVAALEWWQERRTRAAVR